MMGLSIISISAGSTASTYNQNIDKQLAQLINENFSYEIFVYQKTLGKFGTIQYYTDKIKKMNRTVNLWVVMNYHH